MDDLPTRRSVRAIIVDGGRILLIRREKHAETYWAVPGGGVEEGETDTEALRRECQEELGVDVAVGEQFFAHRIRYPDCIREQRYYVCRIVGGDVGTGNGPEYQSGTHYRGTHTPEWVPLSRFSALSVWPQQVKQKILEMYGATDRALLRKDGAAGVE